MKREIERRERGDGDIPVLRIDQSAELPSGLPAVHVQFFHGNGEASHTRIQRQTKTDRIDSHPDSLAVPVVLEDKTG